MVHLGVREQAAQEPGDEPRATPAWTRAGRGQRTEDQTRPADADPRNSGQNVAAGAPRGVKRGWGKPAVEEDAGVGVAVGRIERSGDEAAVARDSICARQAGPTAATEARSGDGE